MIMMVDTDRPRYEDIGRPGSERQRNFPTPEWFIPSSSSVIAEIDEPGWKSADMRRFPLGARLLDKYGVVHVVEQYNATNQRVWQATASLLPRGWDIELTETWIDTIGATSQSRSKLLVIRWNHAVALAAYWTDPDVSHRTRVADFDAFYEELTIQLHRPAPIRKAVMKVVKHPTRRGRATLTNVDPMTPWALRTASERLVSDVSADVDHQTDDVSLKRLVHLTERHEELQCQLDEVAGQLAAAKALLVTQQRSVSA